MHLALFLLLAAALHAAEPAPVLTADQKLEIREAQIEVMKLAPAFNAATKALSDVATKHAPAGYEIQEIAGKLVLVKKPEPPKPVEPAKPEPPPVEAVP